DMEIDDIVSLEKEEYENILNELDGLELLDEDESIPLENDNAFYYDDEFIYKEVERLDPDHSKYILLTDNGASTLMLHVAGRISAMGWGKKKVYLLMGKTSDFLKSYPDVKE
ncbi:MAG: hypothetical protein J5614_02955, partial [Paludibacteraceae bacterium]|nr:hypothetical protein [Paludibacteraceae bacterium]